MNVWWISSAMKYNKLPGAANLLGQQYEYKMAALLLMRGVNQTAGFCMGTNVAGAGAFDDVVFKYKLKDDTEFRTTFMQLKHNEKGNLIITLEQLCKPSGNFSMYKYYKSWCEVAMNVGIEKWTALDLFNVDFSNCEFLIYTNGKIDESVTSERTRCSTAFFDTNKDSTVSNPSFFNDSTVDKIKVECNKYQENDKDLKENLKDVMKKHPVEDFLRNLQWFTRQASEEKLTALIEEEIKTAVETNEKDTQEIAKVFIEKMKLWWEEKEMSDILTETAQLWSDVIVSRLDLMNDSKRKEMEALNISFTDQEIDSFNQSLSSSLVINVTSPHVKLTGLKISQALEKKYKQRYILMGQEAMLSWQREVLRAWQSVWCDVLVIECSTDATSLAQLSEASPGKKLILLSESALPGYQQHHDIFTWNQLEETSKTLLMEKRVDFQGYEVSLGSVVGEHCTHALTGDVVTQLLCPNFKLTIGRKLENKIPYYIPRSLERRDYIKEDIFKMKHEDDFFILSNANERLVTRLGTKLTKLVDRRTECEDHFYWTNDSFTADDFTTLCVNNPEKNIHWLSGDSDSLYWKQSFNDMAVIKQNLDTTKKRTVKAEDVDERVVLVTADPGMGKSSLVTHLAQEVKANDKSQWIIRINLNDVTGDLFNFNEKYFHCQENVIEFLLASEERRECQLGREILRFRLMDGGNVGLFLDGFDEICPHYDDKVTALIETIKQLKVTNIWVTSRNLMRHHLESKLVTPCYSMKPFSIPDQQNFLVQYWSSKQKIEAIILKKFAEELLKLSSNSLKDKEREISGIPLQCLMLAEAFEAQLMTFTERGKLTFPPRLDLLYLYESFVSKKIHILFQEKRKTDVTNSWNISAMRNEDSQIRACHSEAAMLLLLSDEETFLLTNRKDIETNVKKSFAEGKGTAGLIDGIHEDKPRFIHRTFAEFFLALWLSGNMPSSTEFIAQNLSEKRFTTVWLFFDRLLARDCPLHNAVLSADRDEVNRLLTSPPIDMRTLDNVGRTALHLAACQHNSASDIDLASCPPDEEIIALLLRIQPASISVKDTVLDWTPMRYADKTQSWTSVEQLLSNGADEDDLVETKRIVDALKIEMTDFDQGRWKGTKIIQSIVELGCYDTLIFLGTKCQLEIRRVPLLLHAAVRSKHKELEGSVDIVQYFIEAGADLNGKDERGLTALYLSASKGYTNVLNCLIAAGADLNIKDWREWRALHVSAAEGHIDVVRRLIEAGADLNAKDTNGWTPLKQAAYQGQVDVVKCLIRAGADPEVKDNQGWTALPSSASTGHLDVVKCLIETGTDLNVKDNLGRTALHMSAANCHLDVVKCLLEAGADLQPTHVMGLNALHMAATCGHLDVFKYLLEAGADINVTDHYGRTSLHLSSSPVSSSVSHIDVVKYLIETGTDINIKDTLQMRTALHHSASDGQLDVVKCLVEAGADLDLVDERGNTAAHLSMLKGHADIVKYLLEAGADQRCTNNDGDTLLSLALKKGLQDHVNLS